jgi:phosphohistidine phosphatase
MATSTPAGTALSPALGPRLVVGFGTWRRVRQNHCVEAASENPAPGGASGRRVVLVRHAKAANPHNVEDHERPLAGRGERDAAALGRWLRTVVAVPDLAITSTAARARRTWEVAAGELAEPVQVVEDPDAYLADPEGLLELLRAAPEGARTLVLIGHNPGVHRLALLLAAEGIKDSDDVLTAGFPTAAAVVLTHEGPWSALDPGTSEVESSTIARAP